MLKKSASAFVGIDAGTTGCTVMIFDESGKALGHGYEEYPCTSPNPGWSEQDVEAVWKGICNASRQAVKKAALPPDAYRSVGLSSQRGTFIYLDNAKKPLGNSIVWNCGRALKYQEIFSKEISPADHQDHTGMQLSPLWSAAKIAWLRDNEPALFEKTRWFANGQEYFLYRLGAEEWVTDPASLTLNGMMENPQTRLERSHPGALRHRSRPIASRWHSFGPSRQIVEGRRPRRRDCPKGIALCRGGRGPAMRRDRRGRYQAGHGRIHRRHVGRDGRPSR